MKPIKQICISAALILALLGSLFPAAFAVSSPGAAEGAGQTDPFLPSFSDVSDSDWFQIYVNQCVETGLLNGVGDGLFNPLSTISVDEALVMAARVLWLAEGGTGDLPKGPGPEEFLALLGEDSSRCPFACDAETAARYSQSWAWDGMTYLVLRAREEGFSLGLDANPEYPSSRRLFFKALAFASRGLDLPEINDISAVPGTRDADILKLYRAGILTGADIYGALDGQRTLTRAEAAAALARITDPSLRVSFTPADFPYQSYTLTKLTDGALFAGGPTTGLCAVETGDGLFFLTLEGDLLPWPEGGTPSSALQYFLDYVEIGVWATPEAAQAGYGDIRMGLMDKNGDFVVSLGSYDHVQPAQDGTLIAWNGTDGEDGWFLLGADGAQITRLPQLEGADWRSFNNGLLPLRDTASGLFGFVDRTGAWILSPQWQEVSPEGFSAGYAAVQDSSGLWGVIDTAGQQILPCQYQWLACPENSADYTGPVLFLTVDSAGEMMWIDPGGTCYPADPAFAYTNSDSYHNGYAVWRADEESSYPSCCYLDLSGQVLTETFDWAGPIGTDRQGFVGLDGAVYRIEFSQEQTLVPFQPDNTQEVLDFVDSLFAGGGVNLRYRLFSGTGPLSLPADGFYGQIRDLFAQRTWVRQDTAAPEPEANSWILYLSGQGQTNLSAYAEDDWITVSISGTNAQFLQYRAEGGSDDLARCLAQLWDGPEVWFALTQVTGQGQDGQMLGEAYAAAFRKLYLDSGAISAFDLQELALVDQEDSDSNSRVFSMQFTVQPANPSAPCWESADFDQEGRVSLDFRFALILGEDDIWRCEWLQSP